MTKLQYLSRHFHNWYYEASKIPDLNEKQLYNLYTYLCINAEELEKIGVETQNACRRA